MPDTTPDLTIDANDIERGAEKLLKFGANQLRAAGVDIPDDILAVSIRLIALLWKPHVTRVNADRLTIDDQRT